MSSIAASTTASASGPMPSKPGDDLQVSFSHVQLYVDHVQELQVYKDLEDGLNRFHEQVNDVSEEKRTLYKSLMLSKDRKDDQDEESTSTTPTFIPQNRDVIQQLLVGFGFRITGYSYPTPGGGGNTRSVLVTSKDKSGAQFVITSAVDNNNSDDNSGSYHHFDASKFSYWL